VSAQGKNLATAFAPASVANVAVGFDILGFSLDVAGDTVTVERRPLQADHQTQVELLPTSGVVTSVPLDPLRNTATAGLVQLQKDLQLGFGFRVQIQKGIPLGSGMGGSAASAVAAIVAANALLDQPLSEQQMLAYSLIGEYQASGSFHADNLAPSLRGGLTLSRVFPGPPKQTPRVDVTTIPVPPGVHCVLVHPHLLVETQKARGILRPTVTLPEYVRQSSHLAAFLVGCLQNKIELIQSSMQDFLIEPQRAHLIPGFQIVKNAALQAGAWGCSISGSGPSVFAWTGNLVAAQKIEKQMVEGFAQAGLSVDSWSTPLSNTGARLLL